MIVTLETGNVDGSIDDDSEGNDDDDNRDSELGNGFISCWIDEVDCDGMQDKLIYNGKFILNQSNNIELDNDYN